MKRLLLLFSLISFACCSVEPGKNDVLLDYIPKSVELSHSYIPIDDEVLGMYSSTFSLYVICKSANTGKKYKRVLRGEDMYGFECGIEEGRIKPKR